MSRKRSKGTGCKLGDGATDIFGLSGPRMLEALVSANLAQDRVRAKLPELERALTGQFEAHQRFVAAHRLTYLDRLLGRQRSAGPQSTLDEASTRLWM